MESREMNDQEAKTAFLLALRATKNLPEACRTSGIDRMALEKWLAEDPEFRHQVEGIQLFDVLEARLIAAEQLRRADESALMVLAIPGGFTGPQMAVALAYLRKRGFLVPDERPRKRRTRNTKAKRKRPRPS